MNPTENSQTKVAKKEAREQLKLQLTGYLEQQSKPMRTFDRWMKVLEWASLGVAAIVFVSALVVSFMWKSVPVNIIPAAWFAFPTCICLTMFLTGLHTLVLKVFPPVAGLSTSAVGLSIPGVTNIKSNQLVTGREALGRGWAFILGGLIGAAFWGMFAYASFTLNWDVLRPMITILGVAMGVAIAGSILLGIVKGIVQSASRLR